MVSGGVASLPEGKRQGMCSAQLQARKHRIESLPLVLKDKLCCFSQKDPLYSLFSCIYPPEIGCLIAFALDSVSPNIWPLPIIRYSSQKHEALGPSIQALCDISAPLLYRTGVTCFSLETVCHATNVQIRW